MLERKTHHKETERKQAFQDLPVPYTKSIDDEHLDEVLADIDSKNITFEDKLESNKSLFENQIDEFYSDTYNIAETQDDVKNCIELFCKYYPKEAGILLHRNIANTKKAEISEWLLKAGADGQQRSTVNDMYSSFELALFNNAPLELLNLFQKKDSKYYNEELISQLYSEKFVMRDELKPFIRSLIEDLCKRHPNKMGLILNRNIQITSKAELSLWLIEAGASLTARYSDGDSTFYYAITANLPVGIYQLFHKAGLTDTYHSIAFSNRLSLALLYGSDTAFHFFKHHFPADLKNTAVLLKEYDFTGYQFHDLRKLTRQDVTQAKEKLWMTLDRKNRIHYLDRELMEIAFSALTTVASCLTKFELFAKHIPNKKGLIAVLGKCLNCYTSNAGDLLDVTGARICEVLKNHYPNAKDRIAACEKVMHHHLFSCKHEKDWQSELVKIRDNAKLEVERGERKGVKSNRASLSGKRR
ncbi:MAG: hypothetical protein ACYCQI_06790 [Gammaproteobacteria bacterium]